MKTKYISSYIEFESNTELVYEENLDSFHKYVLDLLLLKSNSYYFIISGDGIKTLNLDKYNFVNSKVYLDRLLVVQDLYSFEIFQLLRVAERNECIFTIISDKHVDDLDLVKNIESSIVANISLEGYLKPLYKWLNYSEIIIIYTGHLLSYTCFYKESINFDIRRFDNFVINVNTKTYEI